MDIEYLLASPRGRCTSRYIKANFPEEYEKIIKISANTFSEQLYIYIHGAVDHICPVCGKETPFRNILFGYSQYCSVKCSYNGIDRINKIKKTNLQKYGVENPSQSQQIKDKKRETITTNYGGFGFGSKAISEKTTKTILEKYGVDNVSKNIDILAKKESTILAKYGVRTILETPEVRAKAKDSILKKYGVDSYFKTPEYKIKEFETLLISLKEKYKDLIDKTEDGRWIMKCPHSNCTKCLEKKYYTPQQVYHDRVRNGSELCTNLLPVGATNQGTTIELFVRNILDKNNIKYEVNVRDIIKPKELDIYIPSKHVAIECNGVYWHSRRNKNYHYDKYSQCKENNVQLLSFWEDWIVNKPSIVESILISKLGLCNTTVFARECILKEISSKICNNFLNQNHIQGACKSSVRFGLYYKNDLVAVMCFAKRSKLSGPKTVIADEYELIRFCNKLNMRIVGGASKLLKYFVTNYHPSTIVSFSCNDISNGKLYDALGFIKDGESQCYWYIDPITKKRYHRTSFTKDSIVKKGWKDSVDKTWTEEEVTKDHGLLRIYDSGMTKWRYNITQPC